MSLRKEQGKTYWTEPTKEVLFREAFGLPDGETVLNSVLAALSLEGTDDVYSGKLYLTASYLAFTSLDRRSCRMSLPLSTIRRVEKAGNSSAYGVFALSFTLFHGAVIVLQLNSLRPANDSFCDTLRTRLKSSLALMKALRPFAQTFYSEYLLSGKAEKDAAEAKRKEAGVGNLIDVDGSADQDVESKEWTTRDGQHGKYHGGLGLVFKFPGDPKKLRERSKMRLWRDYFTQHGRNLTLIRYPTFNRLVQVGLPNRLRGEIWELTCGSLFLRLQNPAYYAQILEENKGRTSSSTDDIEKDLHRSLPEYAGYQDEKGIDTMRRVLTAYAWSNPAVGYCQAMNLVVATFLIYMSEEQCFWCLTVLCDRLLPGYYSPSMYGTVLDQRVFEHLVQRCLPDIHDHCTANDIQLSVSSLPWFLSLYISSMPMVFAFRIVDCFFLMGPKVLFQVGLAILKVNGEALLDTTDDGVFLETIKRYFGTLGDSAHPSSPDPRLRQVTRFQELLVTAFREFSVITDETIASERKRFRQEVVASIENFAKRSAIRNLKAVGRLSKNQLGDIYDHFQFATLKSRGSVSPSATRTPTSPNTPKTPVPDDEPRKPETRIDRKTFGVFLGQIATWARDERVVKNSFYERIEREPVEHELIDRIFLRWDTGRQGGVTFQDVVAGLDQVLFNDLMSNISWFFGVHDSDGDGFLSKDEVLQLSESLLFIFRNEPGDRYLGSVSNLLQNSFEYAERTQEIEADEAKAAGAATLTHSRSSSLVSENPHRPYLGLATFRMVVLADELLESFFDTALTTSWKLEKLIHDEDDKPVATKAGGASRWFSGLVKTVITEDTVDRINRLADEVGRRLDVQSIEQRPSLGTLDARSAQLEPTARENLLSTSVRRPSQSIASPNASPEIPNPLSAAAMRTPAYIPPPRPAAAASLAAETNPWADAAPTATADVQRAWENLAERPQFTMDAPAAEDEDDGADVLDEVDKFLEADLRGEPPSTSPPA